MPVAGRKPKAEHRHRVKPVHEWIEVPNVPFAGPAELSDQREWPSQTLEWWREISRMPHCILWTATDWQFARDTAIVAAAFHSGDLKQAVELRQREKIMGTTMDALRDLRIRYVDPAVEDEPKAVSAIEEYRKRLGG